MNIPFLSKPNKTVTNQPVSDKDPSSPLKLSLVDAIAPASIDIDFGHLKINNRYFKSFFVSNYPRYVSPDWLEPLINFNHSLNVSMFIYPSQSSNVLDNLKRK